MAGIGKYKGEGNFKMEGFGTKSGHRDTVLNKNGEDEKDLARKDKKILKESKKRLIADKKKEFKSGDITRKEFRAAKKEIKGYTDVDSARDHFNEPGFRTVKGEKKHKKIYKKIGKLKSKAQKASEKGKSKKAKRIADPVTGRIRRLEDKATRLY